MPRKVRIEYPGAVYHVLCRGDRRQPIYRDDLDRERFLGCVEEVCEKTGWRVHAYVLMGNHYHILIETPEANLVVGMKWFQGTYTQRFNCRHRIHGHLFEGRYKALIVDESDPGYFGIVGTYIHLNPARAGLIRIGLEPLASYAWSSYPAYLLPSRKRPPWLRVDRIFGSAGFELDNNRDRVGYKAWMESRALECGPRTSAPDLDAQWKRIRRGWFLGEKEFRSSLMARIETAMAGRKAESFSGAAPRERSEAEAGRWVENALARFGLDDEALETVGKGTPEKATLAWWLRRHTTVSRRWIAARLRMGHESRVTLAVREVTVARQGDLWKLRRQLERIGESLLP